LKLCILGYEISNSVKKPFSRIRLNCCKVYLTLFAKTFVAMYRRTTSGSPKFCKPQRGF
ncbi:hypothetical protein T06_5111, partial [Trichinella sp. T6]